MLVTSPARYSRFSHRSGDTVLILQEKSHFFCPQSTIKTRFCHQDPELRSESRGCVLSRENLPFPGILVGQRVFNQHLACSRMLRARKAKCWAGCDCFRVKKKKKATHNSAAGIRMAQDYQNPGIFTASVTLTSVLPRSTVHVITPKQLKACVLILQSSK